MAKDFLLFVLIITLLDVAFGLYLGRTSLTKNLGDTFMLICKDDEGGKSVRWLGPKGALNDKTHPSVLNASYGAFIVFEKIKMEDAGNYTCILNGSPQVRKVFSLTVRDVAIGLYVSQTSLTKNLDETFLVICRDEGGQSVTWQGPNGTLNANTRPMVQHASYGTSILFNKTKIEDSGKYTCILNGSSQVRKVFSLTVRDDAFGLYLSQTSLTKNLDETFLVICIDEGGRSVTWQGPNGTLNAKTRPMVQYGSYGTSILFNKTKMEDTGNYTCILKSSPEVRKVFSLTVQDFPPAIGQS